MQIEGLRPIDSRALKSTMDTLRPHLSQAKVLDLYAGKGRFGLATSLEGAIEVTFVEKHKQLCKELTTETKKKCYSHTHFQIENQDVFQSLKTINPANFDLVFADPPFIDYEIPSFFDTLSSALFPLLQEEAIFLVKCPKRVLLSTLILGWQAYKISTFGDSKLIYWAHE